MGGAPARARHDARRGGAGVVGRGRGDVRGGRGRAAARPLRGRGRGRPGRPRRPAPRPRRRAPALDGRSRPGAPRGRPRALAAQGPPRARVGPSRRARRARVPRHHAVRRCRSRGRGLAALLASPAKGALVFAPVALVGIAGLLRALRAPARRLWDQPQPGRFLPVACGLAAAAHFAWLAVAGGWAAGDFWGPRWVAPAWPLVLLVPRPRASPS